MAKTDFNIIDISMKISNNLPVVRITEDITVTVNNRKNNVLSIQAMAMESEKKEETDQIAFMEKAMNMLIGEKGNQAIEELDLPMPEYKLVYETIMNVATGTYGEESKPTE
ncbi:MAG: hypothetical protein Q4F11_06040 [Eubacteriales bacterium]|nr:hypothetical protein [Eubacteriales bacterium]